MSQKKSNKTTFGINLSLILVSIVAVNVIASNLSMRWDVTEENLYTLTAGTEKIVSGLEEDIEIRFFFSESMEGVPLTYKNYGKKVRDLVDEYVNLNPGRISVRYFDPKPYSDEEEWAVKHGLQGLDAQEGKFFMGLAIVKGKKEASIPFLYPRREEFLEYDLTELVLQIGRKEDRKLGILSSLPVTGSRPNRMEQMRGGVGSPKWAFVSNLEKQYQIDNLDKGAKEIPKDISNLLVIHPKNLSDESQYAIDQFVMRGGNLVILIDPSSRMDREAQMAAARMGGLGQRGSDLPKLFSHWGVDYDAGKILGDKDRPYFVQFSGREIPYSIWHQLDKSSFNDDLIATKDFENMLLVQPGGFLLKENSPLTATPLIQSSLNAGLISPPAPPQRAEDVAPNLLKVNKSIPSANKNYYLAAVLGGKLTSAFAKRPESKDPKSDEPKDEDKKDFAPHIAETTGEAKILIIADADFIADQFSVQRIPGFDAILAANENLNFLFNMIDFVGGATDMMSIRSRGKFRRPFEKFIELKRNAEEQYNMAEEELSRQLQDINDKIKQIREAQGANSEPGRDLIEKIKDFEKERIAVGKKLKETEKLLREDIEYLSAFLKGFNMIVAPFFVTLAGLLIYFRRSRQNA